MLIDYEVKAAAALSADELEPMTSGARDTQVTSQQEVETVEASEDELSKYNKNIY